MCDSFDLTVLNGKAPGDIEGCYTFTRGQANSTIDYCLIRGNWHKFTTDLRVLEEIFSDHMPLAVDICMSVEHIDTPPKLLPQLKCISNELDNVITMQELRNALQGSKNGKAPGEDRVPVEFLANAAESF
ncbi:hypothetical protein ACLKA6_019799 [Drosophila palustris]